jgi:hypothetical protein
LLVAKTGSPLARNFSTLQRRSASPEETPRPKKGDFVLSSLRDLSLPRLTALGGLSLFLLFDALPLRLVGRHRLIATQPDQLDARSQTIHPSADRVQLGDFFGAQKGPVRPSPDRSAWWQDLLRAECDRDAPNHAPATCQRISSAASLKSPWEIGAKSEASSTSSPTPDVATAEGWPGCR